MQASKPGKMKFGFTIVSVTLRDCSTMRSRLSRIA
jgi:hypothetical protein